MTIRKVTKYINDEGFEFTFEPVDGSLSIKKTKTGYEARYLVQDDQAESPDNWGDEGMLFLVGYHRDFTVEGRSITKDQCRNLLKTVRALGPEERAFVSDWRDKYHIFMLEAYIHGCVVLALGREGHFPDRAWDVSQLGLVFVSKEAWPEYNVAKEVARGLIADWNMYLSGDVWGCVVETYNKKKRQVGQDSCWGFYGHGNALEELQGIKF